MYVEISTFISFLKLSFNLLERELKKSLTNLSVVEL